MYFIEISEAEKKRQLKAVYNNKDLYSLTRFVKKYLYWFKPEVKLWLYKNKKGLDIYLI